MTAFAAGLTRPGSPRKGRPMRECPSVDTGLYVDFVGLSESVRENVSWLTALSRRPAFAELGANRGRIKALVCRRSRWRRTRGRSAAAVSRGLSAQRRAPRRRARRQRADQRQNRIPGFLVRDRRIGVDQHADLVAQRSGNRFGRRTTGVGDALQPFEEIARRNREMGGDLKQAPRSDAVRAFFVFLKSAKTSARDAGPGDPG